jgi:curved DNA-binding protein CbpA
MAGGSDAGDLGRVLCLAPDCDPASLHIDSSEGFLLSRIDGQTPWRVLREMGAMPPEEVDLCLEGWLARGILVVDQEKSARDRERRREEAREESQRVRVENASPVSEGVNESAIDQSLDLDERAQRRILEFEATLGRSYHEILGVARNADARQIKRAYFKLAKDYHPDRYFRRQIGGYAARLDRIFKKITEAYELLSDPTTRAEVEKSLNASPPREAADSAATPDQKPRPLTPIERLRQRMPFRIPESVMSERRQKAKDFFEAGRFALERGNTLEAASSVRLAIAFDPFNEEYKQSFGEVQAKAAETREARLIEQADSFDSSQLREALRLYEEVLLYRPHDPEINDKSAALALQLDRIELAQEYAERAVEHSPEVARYHRTLAGVHRAKGDRGHAIHELEKALKCDSGDEKAQRMLAALRPRRPSARRGMS